MSVLDKFKRKNDEVRLPSEIPMEIPSKLPDDLERFRIPQPETPRSEFYDKTLEIPSTPISTQNIESDKIELILQKLDTIDTRLKLIEERVKRY